MSEKKTVKLDTEIQNYLTGKPLIVMGGPTDRIPEPLTLRKICMKVLSENGGQMPREKVKEEKLFRFNLLDRISKAGSELDMTQAEREKIITLAEGLNPMVFGQVHSLLS